MSAKYECFQCGYEMDRAEFEQSVDYGCPSCRCGVPESPYRCETCNEEIDGDGYYCDDCLKDMSVDARIDDARNEMLSNLF
jgi:hypothetical protein